MSTLPPLEDDDRGGAKSPPKGRDGGDIVAAPAGAASVRALLAPSLTSEKVRGKQENATAQVRTFPLPATLRVTGQLLSF